MSHYISSFLIEPVVRQARRFSRPSADSEPATTLFTPHQEDEAWARHAALATAAVAAHQEPPQPRMRTSLDAPLSHTALSSDPEVLSPDELQTGQLQTWQHGQDSDHSLRLVETANLEPEVSARRYTLTSSIGDALSNPLSGVSDGPISTRSSLSNSTLSIMEANMSPADPAVQASRMDEQEVRGREGNNSSGAAHGILPADDGMGAMRKRIIAIQRTDSSSQEKARLVHGLMTEKHNSSQQSLHGPAIVRIHSPASVQSSDLAFTPSSPKSTESSKHPTSPPTSSSSLTRGENPFNLSPEDLKPTYFKRPPPLPKEVDQETRTPESDEDAKALGCAHYKRNIKLQCSACSRWYTCRFCHDALEDHMLNRRETKNMLCMLCGCAQPASEECALCSERGAWYYCDVCKLWDDDPQKSIYHCSDCGICRIGKGLGKDFFHCKVDIAQSMCVDVSELTIWSDLLCLHVHIHKRHSSLHRAFNGL